jgi:hypothetical protein
MAMSLVAQPQDFTPAYNEVKFIVDSTNKNLDGFRYIFEIFQSGTLNRIGYYKALPTYGTGYGEQDISKLLSNKVSFDFYPAISTFYDARNSYYKYDIQFGEEYIFTLSYTASLSDDSGNVEITPTAAHPFVVGDQLNIIQADGGVANPGVEGLHTVIAVSGTTSFTINALWSEVTDATINGSIKYADNRKQVNLNELGYRDKYVFNGAIPWIDMPFYDQTDYTLNNVSGQWLTNQPLSFNCTLTQDLWLNAKDVGVQLNERVYFENSNGDVFYKPIAGGQYIKGVAVGPNNFGSLTLVSGTAGLIKASTEYYDVWYSDGLFNPVQSLKYRIIIDRRIQISETHILFLDRMGSWSSFAFQLKSYENVQVKRDTYNKDVPGYVSGTEWKYNTYEQGLVNYSTQVSKSYDLNTNWMSETEGIYFQELITSPQTYMRNVIYRLSEDLLNLYDEEGCAIRIPEFTEYVSCNVTTNSFQVFKQRNKNLIKQSIQVTLSNNDIING